MRTMKKSRENSFLLLTCLLERGMSVRVWKWKCERAESKIQPFHKTRIKWGPHAWKLIENKNQISKQRQTEKYFVCACAHPLQIDSGIRAIMAMCGVFIYTYAHMHRSRYSAQTGMQTNTHRCQPLPCVYCENPILNWRRANSFARPRECSFSSFPRTLTLDRITSDDIRSFFEPLSIGVLMILIAVVRDNNII